MNSRLKNIPNHLTISRFWMTAIMMICLTLNFESSKVYALIIFVVASITDALDGYLARNYFGESSFGKLMDPLADKVLVSSAFIALVQLNMISGWMVALIICREFMITGLRLLMVEKGMVMPAGIWGKIKTIVQMIAIILYLLSLVYESAFLPTPASIYAWIIGFFVMLITAFSGFIYMWDQRKLLSS